MTVKPKQDLNLSQLAHEIGLDPEHLEFFGKDKAKISLQPLSNKSTLSKLILVSAITPTPAGEGKTTVSIGLAQGLRHSGRRAALALRQPSMGPVFGRKGTATGGGKSQLTPAESINLHFTGDFHAITSAHNLLAAAIDNRLHFNSTRLDPAKIVWKRVMDMNDRALRHIQVGLSSTDHHGRKSGFEITAASEIMAILCLSENSDDLKARLNRMIIGFTAEMEPVMAEEMKVTGSMLALLRDAMKPNLVQTLEGVPAFVHGGPFANIAHGCNSVLATRMALAHSDFTVTEAGFAFDLGGEKFIDIKCRQSGLSPDAVVIVATVRALKMHGGVSIEDLALENTAAVHRGLANLDAHLAAVRFFKRPVVVALNLFSHDTAEEVKVVRDHCKAQNVPFAVADVYGQGGPGALELAEKVVEATKEPSCVLNFAYSTEDTVETKVEKIVTQIYGAEGVDFSQHAVEKLDLFRKNNLDALPVCMAKTPDSLSDNPGLRGRPKGFRVSVRDFEIANGAGFLVALTGALVRMPALPRVPAAERIQMDDQGNISGW